MLELTRALPASRPVVFAALTDPSSLTEWWGPEGFEIPDVRFEARVGKGYRIEMQPPGGAAFHLTGAFREVEPPVRLAYTFEWEEPDPDDVETLVTLTLRDLAGSTEVALAQGPFRTEPRRALHRDGWTESLTKLERYLESRP